MSEALEVAAGIGRRLAAEAIWHEGRCNWIGALPGGGWDHAAPDIHAALGPDLYAGTAGIAMVSAELYAATGEAELRRTARGAIRQALSRAARIPPRAAPGLYSGVTGVALAATRVGAALGDPEPVAGAGAILAGLGGGGGDPEWGLDLVAGRAGGIVALLALAGLRDDPGLVEPAARMGDDLVRAARWRQGGCSWPSPSIPSTDDLTGLSHGASGIGLALLELHRATGDTSYREAGLGAFAYERGRFDPDEGNWLDLRVPPDWDPGVGPRFAGAWCHGAPGIALARLRALELLDDPACREDALAALATTEALVGAALGSEIGDWSPCHGLSGLAEVLMWGGRALGGAWSADPALPAAVARAGIEHGASGRPWPCGTVEGETQGLMLGLAGIALFHLRLADPARASALLVRPRG